MKAVGVAATAFAILASAVPAASVAGDDNVLAGAAAFCGAGSGRCSVALTVPAAATQVAAALTDISVCGARACQIQCLVDGAQLLVGPYQWIGNGWSVPASFVASGKLEPSRESRKVTISCGPLPAGGRATLLAVAK